MLNKKSIKTILNVKHTCIDNVKMLADSSIMIEVHATKGQQCWCGICGKKSKFYDNGNQGARTWRACDWSEHKVFLVAPSCRVNCPTHDIVTCKFPWARHDSRFTYKFEEMTAWMAVNCSKSAVAAFMRISWITVGPVISRVEKDLDISFLHVNDFYIDPENTANLSATPVTRCRAQRTCIVKETPFLRLSS